MIATSGINVGIRIWGNPVNRSDVDALDDGWRRQAEVAFCWSRLIRDDITIMYQLPCLGRIVIVL
jgi:hypothetical protein